MFYLPERRAIRGILRILMCVDCPRQANATDLQMTPIQSGKLIKRNDKFSLYEHVEGTTDQISKKSGGTESSFEASNNKKGRRSILWAKIRSMKIVTRADGTRGESIRFFSRSYRTLQSLIEISRV